MIQQAKLLRHQHNSGQFALLMLEVVKQNDLGEGRNVSEHVSLLDTYRGRKPNDLENTSLWGVQREVSNAHQTLKFRY